MIWRNTCWYLAKGRERGRIVFSPSKPGQLIWSLSLSPLFYATYQCACSLRRKSARLYSSLLSHSLSYCDTRTEQVVYRIEQIISARYFHHFCRSLITSKLHFYYFIYFLVIIILQNHYYHRWNHFSQIFFYRFLECWTYPCDDILKNIIFVLIYRLKYPRRESYKMSR